jgi:hypothetical protein
VFRNTANTLPRIRRKHKFARRVNSYVTTQCPPIPPENSRPKPDRQRSIQPTNQRTNVPTTSKITRQTRLLIVGIKLRIQTNLPSPTPKPETYPATRGIRRIKQQHSAKPPSAEFRFFFKPRKKMFSKFPPLLFQPSTQLKLAQHLSTVRPTSQVLSCSPPDQGDDPRGRNCGRAPSK